MLVEATIEGSKAPLIRQVAKTDRDAWRKLWGEYCRFYGVQFPDRVTDATWSRIASGQGPIFGLVAEDRAGALLGFCHYVCHPNTWSDQTVCYLEDLYVSEGARRTGLATRFISFLTDLGRQEGWYRLYWITNADNEPARKAYDQVARRTDHIRYEIEF